MVVLSLSCCPSQLRGDLTKWFQEIDVGVYVGKISARVREKIWSRICDNIKSGRAIMVYSANNEQGYEILTHNTEWQVKDFEGLAIMFKPDNKGEVPCELENGFSNAAKYQMARKSKKQVTKSSDDKEEYVIIDLETTGLDSDVDKIIEVGLLKVGGDEIIQQYQSYVRTTVCISEDIVKMTGITQDVIDQYGRDEKQVLEEMRNFIGNNMVVGYNVQFDIDFLNRLCRNYEYPLFVKRSKDVLKMARRKLELKSYRLMSVAEYFGLETDKLHHALEDCMLVFRILIELNKMA